MPLLPVHTLIPCAIACVWPLYGIVVYFETTLPTQISWSTIAIYNVPNAMQRKSTHCTGHSVYPAWPPAVKIRIQTDRKGRAETLVIVLLPSLLVLFSLICLSKIIR